MDAITILKEDHKKAKRLLTKLAATTERGLATRMRLLEQVQEELDAHMAIEEEIFYPAFRKAAEERDDRIMYLEAHDEHTVAINELSSLRLLDPGSELFAAKAKVLKELVEHHIEEEEGEMFPKARELMARNELVELGEQMQSRRKVLHDTGTARVAAEAARRAKL